MFWVRKPLSRHSRQLPYEGSLPAIQQLDKPEFEGAVENWKKMGVKSREWGMKCGGKDLHL